MYNKDKEQTDDQGSNKEGEREIEQTGKDQNRVRETYFNSIQMQEKTENGQNKTYSEKDGVGGLEASADRGGSKKTRKRKKTSAFKSGSEGGNISLVISSLEQKHCLKIIDSRSLLTSWSQNNYFIDGQGDTADREILDEDIGLSCPGTT